MPWAPTIVAKTMVVLVGCLVVADIVGVLVCTLFDIAPIRASARCCPMRSG